jgi:hypothetical protein
MKKFALLRLHNNSNLVLLECYCESSAEAIGIFNSDLNKSGCAYTLNGEGYYKVNEDTSLSIAEFFNPISWMFKH